jgi:hypothetical protein
MRLFVAVLCLAYVIATAEDRSTQLAKQAKDQKAVACDQIQSSADCHKRFPDGCTAAAGYDAYLNFLKNQLPPQNLASVATLDSAAIMKLEQSLPPSLKSGNHATNAFKMAALKEGDIHTVIGYLYYAQETGGHTNKNTGETTGESCNCQLFHPGETDFHIGIGFDKGVAAKIQQKNWPLTGQLKTTAEQGSMVVEMTPEFRAEFEPKWAMTLLTKAKGKQVKVVGQLIADNEHMNTNDDCGRKQASNKCWRMSIWEIHPVTAFFVCKSDQECSENDKNWIALEKL